MVDGSLAGLMDTVKHAEAGIGEIDREGMEGLQDHELEEFPFPHHSSRTVPRDGVLPDRGDRATLQSM